MNKIMITGASGYLGAHLCRLMDHEKVFAFYNKTILESKLAETIQLDLSDFNELNYYFKNIKPDYVIHLAVVTPSKSIDMDEKIVYEINVEVTKEIASLSRDYNSFLIFTSTDLVYDEGDNIKEDYPLRPLNLYAQTKLEAEKAINYYGKYFLILRTALMYGFSISLHKSFFDFAFDQLMNGKEIRAFYDQYRNPLFVEDAARMIKKLTQMKLPNRSIMNFCGFEKLSRYEMVKITAEIFEFNPELIIKDSCENFTHYKMAKNLGLNFDKMKELSLIPETFSNNILYLKNNFEDYKSYLQKGN